MPSTRSSVASTDEALALCLERGGERELSSAARIDAVAARSASGAPVAIRAATRGCRLDDALGRHDSSCDQSEIPRLERVDRPSASTTSAATCRPATRAQRWVPPAPGIRPRRASGWPKTAVSPGDD